MKFKELRIKHGFTMEEIHELTGIPLRTIQNWEYGMRNMPDHLYRLLEFFLENRKENETLIKNSKGEEK